MRILVGIHVIVIVAILIGWTLMTYDPPASLLVTAVTLAIVVSGGLTAYFYYKRGQVYEKRGESGPDG